MNSFLIELRLTFAMPILGLAVILSGCASSGNNPAYSSAPHKFTTLDERTIDIGKSYQADGGNRYNNPHMEKGKCWVADGFDFNGYETLYIAPTLSTAKFNQENDEEIMVHNLAKERLVSELALKLRELHLFTHVVTEESDIPDGTTVLTMQNTITEFTKGGGAARYWVGLYGGGQPILRVQGQMTDGGKTLFNYEARRSGVSADARLGGVFMKDEDIQIQDIRSLILDLTDFMAAVAGKYQPKT